MLVVATVALATVLGYVMLSSATLQTRTAMGMRVADNLDAFFSGNTPPNRVA